MLKVRMGMVGGGEGSFIGAVHRMAAELDGRILLHCGAFSSDPERSIRSGIEIYGLPRENCYRSYEQMFATEREKPDAEKIQFVVIATPNHVHFKVAEAALAAGFHVMSDKPLAFNLNEAIELSQLAKQRGLLLGLTHNYTGYPMVREARHLVRSGAIGGIRRINVEYMQGWLADAEENLNNKQAAWRTDPTRSGAAGCIGDIGTHGENLVEFITGLKIERLCADLTTFVPGRKLDDDGNVLLHFNNGAKGILSASQIAVGVENHLAIRIYGELGGIEWVQMEPNSLVVRWKDRPYEVRRTGGPGVHEQAMDASRLPAGHPEGFLEAFALLYRNFAQAIEEFTSGKDIESINCDFPTVSDGIRGMAFIQSVVESSNNGSTWVNFPNLEEG